MHTMNTEEERMNYYVPVQDDAPQYEKKCVSHRTARILGRRYALTSTCFKYLEIGISVGPVSAVELVFGDNRGNQLVLNHATWGGLMIKQDDILQLLQATETSSSTLWIRDLEVKRCTMYGRKLIKFTLTGNCLYLQPATVEYMFTLEHCIGHMYSWLFENTHIVNTKFRNFVKIGREKNVTEMNHATSVIRNSGYFDGGSLIDCELLACAMNEIMYEVLNK